MSRLMWIVLLTYGLVASQSLAAEQAARKAEKSGAQAAAAMRDDKAKDAKDADDAEESEMSEADVLALLRKVQPAAAKSLEELKGQDKDSYDTAVEDWAYDLAIYKKAQEDNPEYAAKLLKEAVLNFDSRRIAGQIRRATGKEAKDALSAKLRAVVGEAFVAQVAELEAEVQSHELEIQNIKQRIAKRNLEKSRIIERHVAALIKDEEGEDSDWDEDAEEGKDQQ
jgi:hypothetical protein